MWIVTTESKLLSKFLICGKDNRMAKQSFLQLAHKFNPKKHQIAGYFASEKLDGMRCFWDGGITTGIPKKEVPWANNDKDSRYVREPIASGCWSRYANVIHPPNWWLARLPNCPLDGELYSHELSRQEIFAIIKDIHPSENGWRKIAYMVYDMPPLDVVFMDRDINETNFKKQLRGCKEWVALQHYDFDFYPIPDSCFETTYTILCNKIFNEADNYVASVLEQTQLPFGTTKAEAMVEEMLENISSQGGEGIMLRASGSQYYTERTHTLLKVKKLDDAEVTCVGYVTGRATDKGSKLLGLMGAMIVESPDGKRFEISGFTDAERTLGIKADREHVNFEASLAFQWAKEHPETEVLDEIEAVYFPRGTVITIKYRGKSKDGIPQEARYWRKEAKL